VGFEQGEVSLAPWAGHRENGLTIPGLEMTTDTIGLLPTRLAWHGLESKP
jgi:hypothetical protein